MARCFTGWTILRPRQEGAFRFAKILHDDGEKTVLGHKIEAGGGIRDGERVLEILARHPSTAKFIALKLARRFVSDEPPASLVGRVADIFRKTDGDITAMLRAIFSSPEFNSPAVYRAKVKTPFELVASSMRVLGRRDASRPAAPEGCRSDGRTVVPLPASHWVSRRWLRHGSAQVRWSTG